MSKKNGKGTVLLRGQRVEVECDRPEWEDLAKAFVHVTEPSKEVEFWGIKDKAEFEDGDVQYKAPYAWFVGKKRAANRMRPQVRVPFDAKLLRKNPRKIYEIIAMATLKVRQYLEQARDERSNKPDV